MTCVALTATEGFAAAAPDGPAVPVPAVVAVLVAASPSCCEEEAVDTAVVRWFTVVLAVLMTTGAGCSETPALVALVVMTAGLAEVLLAATRAAVPAAAPAVLAAVTAGLADVLPAVLPSRPLRLKENPAHGTRCNA